MIERLITAIVLALLGYLEKRHEQGKLARPADRDPAALSRIGMRVRDWENAARDRRRASSDGS